MWPSQTPSNMRASAVGGAGCTWTNANTQRNRAERCTFGVVASRRSSLTLLSASVELPVFRAVLGKRLALAAGDADGVDSFRARDAVLDVFAIHRHPDRP